MLRLAVSRPIDIMDKTYAEAKADSDLTVRDFVDEELERLDRAEALDELFASEALTSNEKIVLSLAHQVFHPLLRGAEFRSKNEVTFVYPYNEIDLLTLCRGRSFAKLMDEVLAVSNSNATTIYNRALHKGQRLLVDFPGLTDYKSNVEQMAAYTEARKQELITLGRSLSPDKPLGTKDVRRLHREGKFVDESELCRLFDSLLDFQRACGFEPNRIRANRGMTPEEVVTLALDIKSNGPLTAPEIKRLSKEGLFVSMTVILRLFDRSIVNFYAACGFPAVKQIKSNFHRKR